MINFKTADYSNSDWFQMVHQKFHSLESITLFTSFFVLLMCSLNIMDFTIEHVYIDTKDSSKKFQFEGSYSCRTTANEWWFKLSGPNNLGSYGIWKYHIEIFSREIYENPYLFKCYPREIESIHLSRDLKEYHFHKYLFCVDFKSYIMKIL